MTNQDGRELARMNEIRVLKALHKYAWLRTRDLAVLIWMKAKSRPNDGFVPEHVIVDSSATRMAQRTLSRLRLGRLVIHIRAPDGSEIYGLSEAGARLLAGIGVPAKSGKDYIRRVSLSHYHHRRLANEVAIIAAIQGYRVASEAEIAAGLWFGGKGGINGKYPDVVVRDNKNVWLCEIERSRRNQKDYDRVLEFIVNLWSNQRMEVVDLPGGYKLRQVVFVCEKAFADRLTSDLLRRGWNEAQINSRILMQRLLYVSEAKFLLKKPKPSAGTAKNDCLLEGQSAG